MSRLCLCFCLNLETGLYELISILIIFLLSTVFCEWFCLESTVVLGCVTVAVISHLSFLKRVSCESPNFMEVQ